MIGYDVGMITRDIIGSDDVIVLWAALGEGVYMIMITIIQMSTSAGGGRRSS